MEYFGIISFVFVLPAFAIAAGNQAQVKKLKDELEGLKKEVKELRGGQESGSAK